MHISVTHKILEHLANLAPGTIISSQSLIHLGPRGALDMALSRLNSKNRIKRKAWGMYINTPDGRDHHIDPQTLAEAKAQAFNKTILPFGKTIAHLLKFPPPTPQPSNKPRKAPPSNSQNETSQEDMIQTPTVSTEQEEKLIPVPPKKEGKVLKFHATGSGVNIRDFGNLLRIKCIPLSPKKARNYLLEGGYWVNAVRNMGREYFYKNWNRLREKLPPFRTALNSMRDSFVLMPEWLYSQLRINWANKYNQRKHQLIDLPQRVDNVPREHLNIIWGPGFDENEEISKIRF